MKDYQKIDALVDSLLEDYDRSDPDYKAAEPFLDGIKEFFEAYYSYDDLCTRLGDHNMDILADFRYADIVSEDDYEDPEDWESAKEDALLVSDDGTSAVMSWPLRVGNIQL